MTKCIYCHKEYGRIKDKRRAGKFCSFECYQKHRVEFPKAIKNLECKICGKLFHRKPTEIKKGAKYCSRKCQFEAMREGIIIRGESYNDRHLIRQSQEYKNWRRKAKQLHKNICDKCGIKDRTVCECCGNTIYLHVHHVKSFAVYPDLRFNPENSSVLCSKCHKDL
jgi:hypothetical protein